MPAPFFSQQQMKITHFFTLLLLFGAFFLASCGSKPVGQRELYGLWKSDDPDVEDTIEIKSDRTYLHTYIKKGLPDFTNSGTWELEPIDSRGYQRVSFDDFVDGSLIGRKSEPGYFPPIIEREWGSLILEVDPDDEFGHYTKIK